MTRRPSNLLSSAQTRARARRLSEAAESKPHVSYDALLGIIDRECEKLGRRWYCVPSADEVIQKIRDLDPKTRKEARALVLANLDAFPLRESKGI